jgi:hypothetical protein
MKARVTHFRPWRGLEWNVTACGLPIRPVLWSEDASDEISCDNCTRTVVYVSARKP